MSATPLYRRALGNDFDRLPAPVAALHDHEGRAVATGRCTVERGAHPLARLTAAFFGFPPAGENVALRVVLQAVDGKERWLRDFGGHRTSSIQGEVPGRAGLLFESFGPGRFTIDPRPTAQGLSFALRGASLLRVPLPRRLWPRVVGDATAVEGRYSFEVSIALPLVGLLVSYRGWLLPETPGEAP
jgi:Domain of unknown function (DUF4166)